MSLVEHLLWDAAALTVLVDTIVFLWRRRRR